MANDCDHSMTDLENAASNRLALKWQLLTSSAVLQT